MTIVLLHPFPFDSRLWDQVAAHLGRDDVVAPNLIGCGGRPPSDEPATMAAVAGDIWDQLGDVERPVVVGISLGGYVALEMMRQRPLAGVALVDTKCTPDTAEGRVNRERLAAAMEQRGEMALYAQQSLPTLLGEYTLAHRPAVVAQATEWIEQANPRSVAWLARAMATRPDSTADLAAFDGAVLLVRGEEDVIATRQDYAHMSNAAPVATVVEIPACGHLPPIEDPSATVAVLRDWLAVCA